MAISEIPTNKELKNYQFSIVIGGIAYFLDILYNERMSRHTLSILDSEKNHIVSGIPVLTNVTLTDNFKYLDIPSGDIIPFSADNQNAVLSELGDKVRLYYND